MGRFSAVDMRRRDEARALCMRSSTTPARVELELVTLLWRPQFADEKVLRLRHCRSGMSQSAQRNLRPPLLTSINRIGLPHFEQGGEGFLGHRGRSRWIRREHYRTHCHRVLPDVVR
jgi:hypothetical protein